MTVLDRRLRDSFKCRNGILTVGEIILFNIKTFATVA